MKKAGLFFSITNFFLIPGIALCGAGFGFLAGADVALKTWRYDCTIKELNNLFIKSFEKVIR